MSAPIRVRVEPETSADPGSNLGSGVGPNVATQELWQLAETEHTEQLENILTRGVDINAGDVRGVTALVRAIYNGRLEMVGALIDHGADINATTEDGSTPLGLAAFVGHSEVVRLLVERGADVGKATSFGTSEEMLATARSFYQIAQYLERDRTSVPKNILGQSDVNQLVVVPSLAENELSHEAPFAETVRVDQETHDDSEVTIQTARAVVPDPLMSQPTDDNAGTGQENAPAAAEPIAIVPDQLTSQHTGQTPGPEQDTEHGSAKPAVVRTLKEPPEIWDLVHEAPKDFNPGGAFVTRLTASKTNVVLLMLTVMLIAGLSAFAVITLRDRKRAAAAVQAQEGPASIQAVPASQASAPSSAPVTDPLNAPASAPANTQLQTQSDIAQSPADAVGNAATQSTNSPATTTQPANPQPLDSQSIAQSSNTPSLSGEFSNAVQPTGVSVSNISKRIASHSRRGQNIGNRPVGGEGETAAGYGASAKPQPSQTVDAKENNQKNSADSASQTKRPSTTSSPQSTAPPTTSSAPKAKVIQWP